MTGSAYHFDLSSREAAINSLHNNPGLISPELQEILNRLYPDPQRTSSMSESQLVIMLLAIISRVQEKHRKAIVQLQREGISKNPTFHQESTRILLILHTRRFFRDAQENWEQLRHLKENRRAQHAFSRVHARKALRWRLDE